MSATYPVRLLCRVMKVGKSAFYSWRKRPKATISQEDLHLNALMKKLFNNSRQSLGSRQLSQKLKEEGIRIGRAKTRRRMKLLGLEVKQRRAYKVTTQRDENAETAVNLLNQNFNPPAPNQVWAGDITYLKTTEGWLYLAVVMDLYSRRIVGWAINKRMTTVLISEAMNRAIAIRGAPKGLVFHSDRGSQYTSKRFGDLLNQHGIRASMGDVGACWDNAVVERFFGSLKHDWLFKVPMHNRKIMKRDVGLYMKYYNNDRLHTANENLSPAAYERRFV